MIASISASNQYGTPGYPSIEGNVAAQPTVVTTARNFAPTSYFACAGSSGVRQSVRTVHKMNPAHTIGMSILVTVNRCSRPALFFCSIVDPRWYLIIYEWLSPSRRSSVISSDNAAWPAIHSRKAGIRQWQKRVDDGRMRPSRTSSTKKPIDAFDQMNCSRVETVGTGRSAEPRPRAT